MPPAKLPQSQKHWPSSPLFCNYSGMDPEKIPSLASTMVLVGCLFRFVGNFRIYLCLNFLTFHSLFMFGLRLSLQKLPLKPMYFQQFCFSTPTTY